MRIRTLAVTLTVLSVLGMLLAGCSRTGDRESNVVRLGFKKTSGYMNLFVAQEKGFFEKEGLQVITEEYDDTTVMMQAVVAGRLDATPFSNLEAISLAEAQAPGSLRLYIVAYWTKEKPYSDTIVKKTSNIRSVANLAGRKIGILPGIGPKTWAIMIFRNYFQLDEAKLISLAPNLQLQALAAGQVDAVMTVPPMTIIGELKGISRSLARGLECRHILDPFPAAGAVISARFLQARPKTAAALAAMTCG